ncbi:MAG: SDR family NAD(P)-dependent oxidoreductase [Conexibacter sp.]
MSAASGQAVGERLEGGVAVTGGARGLGRAAALACARAGASVAVLDRDADLAAEVAAEAQALGALAAAGIACDVCEEDSVEAAIGEAARRVGPLRGLVTSAGIDRGGPVHELSSDDWNAVIRTNLTGTFLAARAALRHMLDHDRGGSIVAVSSPWAQVSVPGASPYSASKGGVSSWVRAAALDYAPRGIRVNAVLPGPVDTQLMWAGVPEDEIPAMRARVEEQIALGRLGEPEEIAAAITWLLSDRSSYVTGSQLVVDGGLLAKGSIEQ